MAAKSKWRDPCRPGSARLSCDRRWSAPPAQPVRLSVTERASARPRRLVHPVRSDGDGLCHAVRISEHDHNGATGRAMTHDGLPRSGRAQAVVAFDIGLRFGMQSTLGVSICGPPVVLLSMSLCRMLSTWVLVATPSAKAISTGAPSTASSSRDAGPGRGYRPPRDLRRAGATIILQLPEGQRQLRRGGTVPERPRLALDGMRPGNAANRKIVRDGR